MAPHPPAPGTAASLVLVCGAGISVPPPSDVPSWWGFNNAMFEEARRRFRAGFDAVPPALGSAIDELALDDVGITLFSQLAHDAFAGPFWFGLLSVLDGEQPNAVHRAIAAAAAAGRVRAVVTTNFDTLLERAFAAEGVEFTLTLGSEPAQAWPQDGGRTELLKVHGSVSRTSSLVDLAEQKARGIAPSLRSHLSRLFAGRDVTVMGFSGDDLALGVDYLGLERALPEIRRLRWLVREGSVPRPAAAAVLQRLGPERGFVVEGSLPAALTDLELPVPDDAAEEPAAPGSDANERVRAAVETFFDEPWAHWYGAVLLFRMLDGAGRVGAAAALRSFVRAAGTGGLEAGVSLIEAAVLSLVFHQIGNDEIERDPRQALADLAQARRLHDLVDEEAERAGGFGEQSRLERTRNRFTTAMAAATASLGAAVGSDELAEREADAYAAWRALPEDERGVRSAGVALLRGQLAVASGQSRLALVEYRRAAVIGQRVGDADAQGWALLNRAIAWARVGSPTLALVQLQAIGSVSGATRPPPADHVADLARAYRSFEPAVLDEEPDRILDLVRDEVGSDGGLLDELLATLVELVPATRHEELRRELSTLAERDGLPPVQRVLLGLAVATLAAQDDSEPLLAIVRPLAGVAASSEPTWPLPDAPQGRLAGTLQLLARLIGTAGTESFRAGHLEEAVTSQSVASLAFRWSGENEEADRAGVYLVDGLRRLGRLPEALEALDRLQGVAGPRSWPIMLERRVKCLVELLVTQAQVAPGDLDPVTAALDELRRIGEAGPFGHALAAYAQLEAHLGMPTASRHWEEALGVLPADEAALYAAHPLSRRPEDR